MQLYHYSPETGEYLRESQARLSPADRAKGRQVYLIPAHAVTDKPTAVKIHEKPVWNGEAWTVVPDRRGQVHYNPESGAALTITRLGEVPGVTTPPPADLRQPRWDGAQWIETAPDISPPLEARLAALEIAHDVLKDTHETLEARLTALEKSLTS
ncbi:MAG: hypothetical protein AB1641_09955 [Thermodesulfobacteriota bacterium]